MLYTYIQQQMTRYALEMQTLKRLLAFLCFASQVCYKLCVVEITLFQNIKLLIKETTQGNFPVEQYMLWDNSSHYFFNEFLA